MSFIYGGHVNDEAKGLQYGKRQRIKNAPKVSAKEDVNKDEHPIDDQYEQAIDKFQKTF